MREVNPKTTCCIVRGAAKSKKLLELNAIAAGIKL
jgi:hypothetical protein